MTETLTQLHRLSYAKNVFADARARLDAAILETFPLDSKVFYLRSGGNFVKATVIAHTADQQMKLRLSDGQSFLWVDALDGSLTPVPAELPRGFTRRVLNIVKCGSSTPQDWLIMIECGHHIWQTTELPPKLAMVSCDRCFANHP